MAGEALPALPGLLVRHAARAAILPTGGGFCRMEPLAL